MKRYFEYSDGKSAKFWEIILENTNLAVRFGKIGTGGQTSVKTFDSEEKARKEHDKLIREKTGKGYTEASTEPLPGYVKMVEETGKIPIVLQEVPQQHIIDWCRIADDVPLINGNLYNIGFFPKDVNPETLDLNWKAIAEDMDFLQDCISILKEAGCHHWRKSDTDSQYYPIIFPPSINRKDGIFKALGIKPELMATPFFYYGQEETEPTDIGADFFEEEAIQEILDEGGDNEDYAEDMEAAEKDKAAYDKVTKLMQANMTGISDYGILAGYDYYPIFRLGISKATGQWIGFVAVVSNRYVYG